jgi:uncharacterized LabA/DUF88 family protein
LPHSDRLNIAVFIDFDNIEIGVKNTLGQQFDIGTILDAIKERGEVVSKIAYADWTRASEYSRTLTQHAIRLVQRNLTPGGDKNGADINMALDALEMAFTHQHINAYVIVGGDSDFLSLVEKLKQYDKKVFVVGGRAFTSVILQRNCHEFIAYENLAGVRKTAAKTGRPMPAAAANAPVAQAVPIVRRALKILADREVSPQTGLLKSTLLQLDSTFSERNYGASSFLDFVEKLSQIGIVALKHAGRSVMVELNPAAMEDGDHAAQTAQTVKPRMENDTQAPEGSTPAPQPEGETGAVAFTEPVRATESAEAGVARASAIIAAATGARWPMYLRNVKQILRQAEGGFDERRYGFGGLMDLLKALQRDGIVRIERDRRGGLRVLQGQSLQRHAQSLVPDNIGNVAPAHERRNLETDVDVDPMDEQQPAHLLAQPEPVDADVDLPEDAPVPAVVDPTAELLGRAKHRKARTPAKRAAAPKPAAKKAAPKRSRKKAAAGESS